MAADDISMKMQSPHDAEARPEPAPGAEAGDSNSGRRNIVAEHYVIEDQSPIGAGGMALVYRGRDLRTRRAVALKTLKPEWVVDPGARSRFRHEARTMAFLAHPNLARVYDLFEPDDTSQPWVVLELLSGPSLQEEIRDQGPLDIDRIAHLLSQLAAALEHLHGRGLCHLDVKPQNILFSDPMTVKLIDFGIAQPTGSSPLGKGESLFGSVAWLSPEQAAGERIGPASDTYSLGCVVYQMVTGTTPFIFPPDTDPQVMLAAHLTAEIEPPTQRRPDLVLPNWIDDIVLDALERDPARRYKRTAQFSDAFRGAMEAETPPDSTVPLDHLPRFDPRRNPTVVFAETPRVAANRHSRPLVTRIGTRFLWKLVGILLVANLLLAALSVAVHGDVPGLYRPTVSIQRSTRLRVDANVLNVRSGPDQESEIVTQLARGTRVTATGLPVGGWIPVRVNVDGNDVDGFVSIDHVEALPRSGIDRLADRVEELIP